MNLFDFYIPEEFFVAVSLLILFLLLKRFFWKPVMAIIDSRQKHIDDMLGKAEDARGIVAEMEKEREKQAADLERQAVLKVNEARERASREYDRIVTEAQEKARGIMQAAEEQTRRQYREAMSAARDAVVSLALGAASAIVESSMDSEKNRELIDAMLVKAGVGNG